MQRHTLKTITAVLSLGGLVPLAQAGYGLVPPASGPQSAGLANSVLAVTDDTDAINLNPAGLSHIEHSRFDAMFESAYWLVHHKDDIGGKTAPSDRYVFIGAGGYARRLNERWVAGIALSAQGGSGFTYKNLPNAFGAPDDVSALFGSVKLAPGIAWQVSERLALGLSTGLVYSTARQKLLPKTSAPGFGGFRLDSLAGFSANARVGVQFQLTPQWTLAAGYATETPVKLENGRMTINRSVSGESPLIYEDVSLSGLNFAPETSLGFAFRPNARWQFSGNLIHYDWSSSLQSTRLRAAEPNDPSAPATQDIESPLDFRDTTLIALGVQHQWTTQTVLRAGLGYARNPQRAEYLSPALNLLADRTASVGFAHRFGEGWEFTGSALLQPTKSVDYNSPLWGGPAQEGFGALALYIGIGRDWGAP